jgi:hypothetical protein
VNCVPVADTQEIQRVYPLIAEACLRVGKREGEAYFAPALYAEIMAGHWALFVVYDHAEPVGVFVCRAQSSPRSTTAKMFVLLAYVVPGRGPDALSVGFAACKQYAANCQCSHVQFASKRIGWARRAQQLGYKPAQQLFELEVLP